MATHSSVLAWRIPGTAELGGLLSMGSHRVGHNWSNLAAAAAALEHKLSRVPVFKVRTSSSEPTLLVTHSDTILYYSEYINQWKRCFWHKVIHIWYGHMNSEKPTYTFIYDWVPSGRFSPAKNNFKRGIKHLKNHFPCIREALKQRGLEGPGFQRGKSHGWVSQLCATMLTLGALAKPEDKSRAEMLGSSGAKVPLGQLNEMD